MARAKLTKRAVDAFAFNPDGPSWQILWDGPLAGFGVRAHPSGRSTYVLRYRAQPGRAGRRRLLVLGPVSVLTLEQARRKARTLLGQVLEGRDPAEERLEARRANTFGDLAEAFRLEVSAHKRSRVDDEQRIRDFLLPAWRSRPAASLRRSDVSALHKRLGSERGETLANRTLALVSAIYAWGERTGRLPSGHPNPARGVAKFKETSRSRWLTREETRRILLAVKKEPGVSFRAFVWLSLLTGCRKSELLSLQWRDVSTADGFLRLPTTKAGRSHVVPLSSAARQVLDSLPHEAGNPYVLCGASAGSHLVNVRKPWLRVCESAGVEDVHLHDLRRTVGSWLAQSGASLQLVGAVLNHSNASTSQIYARLGDSQERDALEAHGAAVLEAAGGALPRLALEAGE